MLKNYFKTAWRSLKNSKGFFFINFVGLYISVVVCTLIALIIFHELSFDQASPEGSVLYRVVKQTKRPTGISNRPVTPYPLATALRVELPDEKLISQIHYQRNVLTSFGDKKIRIEKFVFADSVFPTLFNLPVVKGSIQNKLAQPGFVFLTEAIARKIFGDDEAVGKRIKLDNAADCEVAAVIKDAPKNTHLPYDGIASYPTLRPELIGGLPLDQWDINSSGFVYMGIPRGRSVSQVEAALASLAAKNLNSKEEGKEILLSLQPVSNIHYNQQYAEDNVAYTINFRYLYLLSAIAVFLILAACINYTNLATSLAIKKSKETGIRKTMGASRSQIIQQFFSETFLLTGIVVITAASTVRFFLPPLNIFLDKNIPLNWLNWKTGLFLILVWMIVSFLSGVYPSLVLSRFNPVNALKNKLNAPKASILLLRRSLVVFQFFTAQLLIIGAIIVAKQMHYMQSKPLGFQREGVLDIELPENKAEQISTLRNKLSAIAGISNVSLSLGAPVSGSSFGTDYNLREKYTAEKMEVDLKLADKEYMKTYGLQLVAGRWFDESDERKSDRTVPDSLRQYSLVINETSCRQLGIAKVEEAIGKNLSIGLNDIVAPVIGVMKDYHIASLHQTVGPVVIMQFPFFYYNAGIKVDKGFSASTLLAIEKAWSSVYPQYLFETSFLDEYIANLYKNEKRTQQLFYFFTILSIIINVLGLIGLLSFMLQQKTKEIGVRKVLGASVFNISALLSKDFVLLMGIGFLLAVPLAWFIMGKWLQDFAYRTTVSWWVFAVAFVLALIVTIVAVAFQTIKAAVANPIKSLRTE